MDVVVRRYIDILTIIINFPYSTCISSFVSNSIPTSFSFLKCFFGLIVLELATASLFLPFCCAVGYVAGIRIKVCVLSLYILIV